MVVVLMWQNCTLKQEDTAVEGDSTDQLVEMADKETNTECMFMPLSASLAGSRNSLAPPRVEGADPRPGIPVIKRSQTFTPSAAVGKSNYVCRVSLGVNRMLSGNPSLNPFNNFLHFSATVRCVSKQSSWFCF